MSDAGHQVDIVTFPEGSDRSYPGVAIYRARPWFGVSGVRPGFSLKKVYCDLFLFVLALQRLRGRRYDVVHAVEESAFFALLSRWMFDVPFIYDMDSLLSAQMVDKYAILRPFRRLFKRLESLPIRRAAAVAPMCQDLADEALRHRDGAVVVVKDVSLIEQAPATESGPDLRSEFDLRGPIVMYIGNLEPYQGIDLLLEAFHRVPRESGAALVVIGGAQPDIQSYRKRAEELAIGDRVHFAGPRPVRLIGAYLRQAQILVSPRVHGTNTPMKVYSYLHSGVPVVATRLPTHTQVMDAEIAVLTEPDPDAFAAGIQHLLDDPARAAGLGAAAAGYAEREHSFAKFASDVRRLYQLVANGACAN